jgi:predicted nuclease with TOPRIM domain
VFHKGTEKGKLTEETLKLQEEKEEDRQAIARLRSRNRQLEDQIHMIAGEVDLGRGVQCLVSELGCDLSIAEEMIRHLQGR